MKTPLFSRFIYAIFACCLLGFSLAGCRAVVPASQNNDGRLAVVATTFPGYDLARAVGGDHIALKMLLPPGAETHSFEPTPQDIITIQNCDVFIYGGGDSDGWVKGILASMNTDAMTIIKLMDVVEVVKEELVEGMTDHEHDHVIHEEEHDHEHHHEEDADDNHEDEHHHEVAEYDEHVWTSPKNTMLLAQAVWKTFCDLDNNDSEKIGAYQDNLARYLAELEKLDTAFTQVVAQGQRKTLIFGDRFPFRYFVDAYGLDYFAAFPGCAADTEPSAETVAFLINKVRAENIPVVFYIELSNQRMADTIVEETGAEKLLLHACHNITKIDFEGGVTYLDLMKQNLENLKQALA